MVYVTRKPGETLILDTPSGKLVIQVLGDNQLAIEAPAGVQVAGVTKAEQSVSWLPARPRLVHVA
jgi:sRNA-binding carbon storage regulator CsrA